MPEVSQTNNQLSDEAASEKKDAIESKTDVVSEDSFIKDNSILVEHDDFKRQIAPVISPKEDEKNNEHSANNSVDVNNDSAEADENDLDAPEDNVANIDGQWIMDIYRQDLGMSEASEITLSSGEKKSFEELTQVEAKQVSRDLIRRLSEMAAGAQSQGNQPKVSGLAGQVIEALGDSAGEADAASLIEALQKATNGEINALSDREVAKRYYASEFPDMDDEALEEEIENTRNLAVKAKKWRKDLAKVNDKVIPKWRAEREVKRKEALQQARMKEAKLFTEAARAAEKFYNDTLTTESKNALLHEMIAEDAEGKTSLQRKLSSPEALLEVTWYLYKGKEYFASREKDYQKQIADLRDKINGRLSEKPHVFQRSSKTPMLGASGKKADQVVDPLDADMLVS